jgi:hypothetical protein
MSRFAMVDAAGFVVNVIAWDGNEQTWRPPEGHTMVGLEEDAPVGPGWSYEDGEFTAPPAEPVEPPPEPGLPPLSPRQIRLGLLGVGITGDMVTEALQGNAEGLIEWQYATQFERDHPLIEALAGGFGLTSEQIDELWANAATL